jgi:chromosome partitioning protein
MANIVLFGVGKGGTGKSTLCQNVAAVRASLKYRTAIFDLDWRQATTGKWCMERKTKPELAQIDVAVLPERELPDVEADIEYFGLRLNRMMPEYDDIFVEVGGQDGELLRAAMTVADKIVAPIIPSPADFNTVPDFAKLVRSFDKKLDVSIVLNEANESPRLTRDIVKGMEDYEDAFGLYKTQIGGRVAFKYAMAGGWAAHEIPTKRQGFDAAAAHEIKDLYLEIFGR